MSEVAQFVVIQVVGILVTTLTVGVPAIVALRKLSVDKHAVEASSNKTEVEIASLWHETYEKMYRAGIDRDQLIQELQNKLLKLETQLELKTLSEQAVKEENARLLQRINELEDTLKRERIDHLIEINELKARLEKLEQKGIENA